MSKVFAIIISVRYSHFLTTPDKCYMQIDKQLIKLVYNDEVLNVNFELLDRCPVSVFKQSLISVR